MQIELEMIGSQKPWIARITGKDPKFGVAREFIQGTRDYSRANKPRTRGVYTVWSLEDGIYEINAPRAWGKTDRFFVRIAGGQQALISAAELMDALAGVPNA